MIHSYVRVSPQMVRVFLLSMQKLPFASKLNVYSVVVYFCVGMPARTYLRHAFSCQDIDNSDGTFTNLPTKTPPPPPPPPMGAAEMEKKDNKDIHLTTFTRMYDLYGDLGKRQTGGEMRKITA